MRSKVNYNNSSNNSILYIILGYQIRKCIDVEMTISGGVILKRSEESKEFWCSRKHLQNSSLQQSVNPFVILRSQISKLIDVEMTISGGVILKRSEESKEFWCSRKHLQNSTLQQSVNPFVILSEAKNPCTNKIKKIDSSLRFRMTRPEIVISASKNLLMGYIK